MMSVPAEQHAASFINPSWFFSGWRSLTRRLELEGVLKGKPPRVVGSQDVDGEDFVEESELDGLAKAVYAIVVDERVEPAPGDTTEGS